MSTVSSPNAETLPGLHGTSTPRTPRISISGQISSDPDPPNVTSVKSRTSRPRLTVIWRTALAWFHAETSRIPAAHSCSGMPSFAARSASPDRAASAPRRRTPHTGRGPAPSGGGAGGGPRFPRDKGGADGPRGGPARRGGNGRADDPRAGAPPAIRCHHVQRHGVGAQARQPLPD